MDNTQKKSPSNSHENKKPFTPRISGPASSSKGKSRYASKKRSTSYAKPVAPKRGPVNEYTSVCCSAPARKPAAAEKATTQDPETRKIKDSARGLGKWRCGTCGKAAKVTVRKAQLKAEVLVEQLP